MAYCGFFCASYIPLHLDLKLGLPRTVVDSPFLVKAIPLEQTTCPQCFSKADVFSPRIIVIVEACSHE